MRAVVQRVSEASVSVEERLVARIDRGLLVLLGIAAGDATATAQWMAAKLAGLRIFENEAGKFDRSVADVGGAVLIVSQFTLCADTRKGRRPSFATTAPPEQAAALCRQVVDGVAARGLAVGSGEFGARMQVRLVNDGPVTIVLDSTP
jgi:D-tyrosyl-tRNA(Tyr) deacylase